MNYFVEGLQGSGKSTLVRRLSEKYHDYKAFCEGDYSPVELAWCAYVDKKTYAGILDKYNDIRIEIMEKSYEEDDHMIICYTKIITDIPGFHKDLERHEIYNGNLAPDSFREIVLRRLRNWSGDKYIFECSLFQNIVEDMILFQNCSDQEIIDFYKKVKEALAGKEYQIMYIRTEDIASNIDVIRKIILLMLGKRTCQAPVRYWTILSTGRSWNLGSVEKNLRGNTYCLSQRSFSRGE